MTTLRVPAEHEPERTLEAAGDRSKSTGETGDAENVRRAIFRWAGSGARGEFFRYVIVGGIATICDASTLYSVTEFLKVNYLISAPIGFMVGTVVNYLLSRSWVFERRTFKNKSAELTIFTLIGVVGLGLNELILWFFQAKLGIFYLFAKGVSACVVLVWNFGARKLALFR